MAAGARALARRKADAVQVDADELVVAADTCVVLDGGLLEKPRDADDARRMLRALAGRTHEVITGFCVRRGGKHREGAVHTRVGFRSLSHEEIERYLDSGEPFDKAGAYGIQGAGGALVDKIDGSYTNVVGLPLSEVLAAIEAVS
jgi:septum formation protein